MNSCIIKSVSFNSLMVFSKPDPLGGKDGKGRCESAKPRTVLLYGVNLDVSLVKSQAFHGMSFYVLVSLLIDWL